jgi:subtilisin-like proprotein convertase family protein
MKKLLLMALVLAFGYAGAQKRSPWRDASTEKLSNSDRIKEEVYSANQKLMEVDLQVFKQSLSAATEAGTGKGVEITLPTVNGDEIFNVWETSNFAPELRAQYPDIKSYVGRGVTDKAAYIRFSVSPQKGLSTMVLRPDNGSEFIEPYTKDQSVYVVFDSKTRVKNRLPFNCTTEDVEINADLVNRVGNETARADNQVFRTYRLALSCTGEYTVYHGGTVADALAAMNATMTRVNGVLDVDMGVKLQIIPTNNLVIYTSAASDPYSAAATGSAGAWNTELQNTLTNVLGNAAYDIGHLFGASGGGGNAGCIGCICEDDTVSTTDENKGSGFTSPADNIPEGDNFDIDYVIHEMGHQMGANHTFSSNVEGTGVNIEPGSGVTIMGYAGVTGGGLDVQGHSIAIFAYRSILQMQTNLNLAAHNCSTNVPLAGTNATPVVSAGADYTIPNGTAFILTGTGSDADGDILSYVWEQNDNATAAVTGENSVAYGEKTVGPNWRTFLPTSTPVRILPQLSAVLAGSLEGTWECVSTVGRTLNFNLTARDNHPNAGQTKKDANVIIVSPTIGPFAVTSQSTSGLSWTPGSTQTITWDVAGTTALPGSATVDIKMSADGGVTWPYVLAAATANDGSEIINVPSINAQTCRIWIQPTGHIYFAVNPVAFSIGYACNIASVAPNLAIPDGTGANVGGAIAQSTLTVPTVAVVNSANMKVNLSVNHAYMGDLVVKLKHPDGVTVRTLLNRPCNAVGQFSSTAAEPITFQNGAPTLACTGTAIAGTYAPNQSFTSFEGKATNGVWTLTAQDFYNIDAGTIVSWGLDFGCVLGTPGVDESDFSIVPNPNSGVFSVQYTSPTAGDVAITVHDIRGRKVFENKYTNTGMFIQNISLNSAETGIYLVTVQDGNKKMVKKIVVQ